VSKAVATQARGPQFGFQTPDYTKWGSVCLKHQYLREWKGKTCQKQAGQQAWRLSPGFYSCTNIMTKKQVGEKRVYSAYISTLLFITRGSQDWNSSRSGSRGWCRGHGGMFLTGLLPLACSACSLIESKTTSPEMVPPTRGSSPLITKRMPHSWISWRHFPNWSSFLCDKSSLCQVDTKLASTPGVSNHKTTPRGKKWGTSPKAVVLWPPHEYLSLHTHSHTHSWKVKWKRVMKTSSFLFFLCSGSIISAQWKLFLHVARHS
jgi:hypothetical protein